MAKKNYVVGFKDKDVNLFDYNGKFIRRFRAKAKVVNAQINYEGQNPVVAITMENGKFIIYKADGQILRQG